MPEATKKREHSHCAATGLADVSETEECVIWFAKQNAET